MAKLKKGEMKVSDLLRKQVITNKGNDLGVVAEVELAWRDKCIRALIVEPSKDYARKKGGRGFVEVPWSSVLAVGKYILVDEDKIRFRQERG